jgi:DNA-binding GntR family transcriptional regulator
MLSTSAYETLKAEILSNALAPRTALQEEAVAKRLDVSRTPVREALRRLGHEGLVTMLPGRGMFVSDVSHRDLVEVFQIRQLLEPELAALAAGHCAHSELDALETRFAALSKTVVNPDTIAEQNIADRDLHSLIVAAAGNNRLEAIMKSLNDVVSRARSVGTPYRYRESIREHRKIIAALQSGNPAQAREAMRNHLAGAHRRILAVL